MIYKNFLIDDIDNGKPWYAIFNSDRSFLYDKKYDGMNLLDYIRIVHTKHADLVSSLIGYTTDMLLLNELSKQKRAAVYSYLLDLFCTDIDEFILLVKNSCFGIVRYDYCYNTLYDIGNIVKETASELKDKYKNKIEIHNNLHLTTISIFNSCDYLDCKEDINRRLSKIYEFLYEKKITNHYVKRSDDVF